LRLSTLRSFLWLLNCVICFAGIRLILVKAHGFTILYFISKVSMFEENETRMLRDCQYKVLKKFPHRRHIQPTNKLGA